MLAALVCVPASIGSAPAAAADPIRILLVGDSVTQGSSGDWTWRYRLWRHFQDAGQPAVDFVGPRTDVWDYLLDEPGSQDYVDPAFDRDHAARWGMTLAFADAPIDDLVETYAPDVVVAMLGTNDLIYLNQTPAEVEQNIENLVEAARSADPGVNIVLAEVTQTWFAGAPEFNALLAEGASALDEPGSRVVLADAGADYSQVADTFDTSHPNAQGEVKIAAAVADALAGIDVGLPPTRPLPAVPLGPRIPPVLSVSTTTRAAHLEWVRSPGAQRSEVWTRDVTAGGDWERVEENAAGTTYDVAGLEAWHQVEFYLRPFKGALGAEPDAVSPTVGVEVLGDDLGAPAGVTVEPGGPGALSVAWAPVPHAASYDVEWRALDATDWTALDPQAGESALVGGLDSRRSYEFRVRARRASLESDVSEVARARVPASAADPARVMLVGDSNTIGSSGDWTWRYRLWKRLAGTAPGLVDLVGPRTDLYDRATKTYGHQTYVDPAFDRDHAGYWGRGVAFPAVPTDQLVADHGVDTLVVNLGANDLQYLHLSPETIADRMRVLVADARSANPQVDVILGEITPTWLAGAPELNVLIHEVAADLDTGTARVIVAETADGYTRLGDTYDDSHSNARGEAKVARAVADALASDGIGTASSGPLPSGAVGPRKPVTLRAKVKRAKVKGPKVVLRWSASPGADDYRVLVRRPAKRKTWRIAAEVAGRRLVLRDLRPGWRYEFLVLPRKGRDLAAMDVRSNRISVRV